MVQKQRAMLVRHQIDVLPLPERPCCVPGHIQNRALTLCMCLDAPKAEDMQRMYFCCSAGARLQL